MIPFVPIFVIPYFSWFLLIGLSGVILYAKSKQDLRMTFFSVNLCMVIGMLVYVIYPNYQSLRPTTYGGDIFSQWVKLLQQGDSPSSVCPSLHVAVCISLYFGITRSKCYADKTAVRIFMLALTILICASTVFIKQHSIVDVACGAILSISVYLFVYKFYYNQRFFPSHVSEERMPV